jgi:hypothetical protein
VRTIAVNGWVGGVLASKREGCVVWSSRLIPARSYLAVIDRIEIRPKVPPLGGPLRNNYISPSRNSCCDCCAWVPRVLMMRHRGREGLRRDEHAVLCGAVLTGHELDWMWRLFDGRISSPVPLLNGSAATKDLRTTCTSWVILSAQPSCLVDKVGKQCAVPAH